MFLAVSLAIKIFLIVVAGMIIHPFLRGAPFAPTTEKRITAMIKMLNLKPGERAIDIGSGDGRIVIALAKTGVHAEGYEINPVLVWWSRFKIKKAGLAGKALVHWGDFWKVNFSQLDAITVFGIPHIMGKLGKKLQKELRPGARVVSNNFKFTNWNIHSSQDGVHLYVR